ncbi:Hypothetical protein GbCGDNIH9_1707 [Granulibacter bethesdensis]|uniref:Uncharacterized protein n=1 Tax=Granulibacter bethesdensis TaxID=364410 RepID=A0AAC9P9H0_9PROT|nr:hypothetical protein [Granulibacter bethesdensis]APH55009.1 Hypothetical protein GbCGDNIH9_1707 [Granulibacter bethesdensis]APH62595.1 Hypothetical protein GbCGDNIH8_1707 [Granulibacter bethesdensis]
MAMHAKGPDEEHVYETALHTLLDVEKLLAFLPVPLTRELIQAALMALKEECVVESKKIVKYH